MKCPSCKDFNLAISDRQGIEIDYCPECRGIWLDRGELDKIIERSDVSPAQQKYIAKGPDKFDHGSYGSYKKHKKSKSFLGELLDF